MSLLCASFLLFIPLLSYLKHPLVKQVFRIKIKHTAFSAFIICLLILGAFQSKAFQLSNESRISIITCAPGNGAATVYGHSAIRVKDAAYNYDLVFNYGIYDFEAPHFLYRFASGQTDYLLAAFKFEPFINSYKQSKRSVYEQELNLTLKEKQKIVDFLIWNAKPENRVYRYNFFFDNCATRVRDVIAGNVDGGLTFQEEKQSHKTLRQLVNDYHGKLLWLTFGIDMVVSSKSDREATYWEEMLLPDYLMNHFATAVKKKSKMPLIKSTTTIYQAPSNTYKSLSFISPFVIFLLLTLLVLFFSFKQYQKRDMNNRLDIWVYGFNGFIGLAILWFVLFSEHPAMRPNYNLLWAVPLNLLFAFALLVKKWRLKLKYYHLFVSAWLILFLACSTFIPQHFHPVYYLLVSMILSRSLFHSLLFFQQKRKA